MFSRRIERWLGHRWSPTHTCLDFAIRVSNEITGLAVRNPERDPDMLAMLGRGDLPDTIPGAVRLHSRPEDDTQPGDVWILRPVRECDPFHACVVIDEPTVVFSERRAVELSRSAWSRVVRMRSLMFALVARFRPCAKST